MIQASNPATVKWHQEPAATEAESSGSGNVAPHGSMMAKESAGPLASFRSVFSRRVSTRKMPFKPVHRVDLPSPAMSIVRVPPALRLSLFNELFVDIIRQHEEWGLVLDDGVPDVYAPQPTMSPSGNLLPRELVSSTCRFYYQYSGPEDRHRPFYGHDYPEFSDNTSTFQPLITRRTDELVAQGIALPVAVSVAINEYLDAMLAALDRIVVRALVARAGVAPFKIPLYVCIFELFVCFFLASDPDVNLRNENIAFHKRHTCEKADPGCFGRLVIHSTDGHTFVELMTLWKNTGRAIGLYPRNRVKPEDRLAPKSSEIVKPPEPLRLVEDLSLSATDILPASITLATMAGFNGLYLALPDRSVNSALRHGFLSLGIPNLIFHLSTLIETRIFMRRGQLVDEYHSYRDEPVSGVRLSFGLSQVGYQRLSTFLDEEIDRSRRGNLSFNGYSDNSMHFTQRVFHHSGYLGRYTDYLPDYVRLSEKFLITSSDSRSIQQISHLAGSIALFVIFSRLAVSTVKVTACACRWLWSGVRTIGKSVRDRHCNPVPQAPPPQIPR